MIAPVNGSGSIPAWITLVANFIFDSFLIIYKVKILIWQIFQCANVLIQSQCHAAISEVLEL